MGSGMSWAQGLVAPHPVADLGTLPLGVDSASFSYRIKNTGPDAAAIGWVSSSCDCATPDWPKLPIAPGDSADIRVRFRSKEPGPFEKSFTVYDDLRRPIARLVLKGVVLPKVEPLPPGPIRYQMDFNALDTDSGRLFFQNLAVRMKATGRPKQVLVNASASRVPTKSYASNKDLAKERAGRAKALLSEALRALGVDPSVLQWGGTVQVQGPPWKPGTPMETYRKFQYVAVEVVY